MKLVELLAREVSKWPKGAKNITQDSNGAVSPCTDPHGDLKFCGSRWISTNGFQIGIDILGKNDLASDYKTAIVTREMWQAERYRQKGGEWKRHRAGRKQPVPDRTKIEAKFRDGEIHTVMSDRVDWIQYGHGSDLMQYRVISQPQA